MNIEQLTVEALARLRAGGYPKLDPEHLTYTAKVIFNRQMQVYLETDNDIDESIELERLVTAYGAVKYGGADPKTIPAKVLRFFVANPVDGADNAADLASRERVRNPNTAIRAKCVACMGGQPNEVRMCAAVTCALWPFRMGKNPFFGRLVNVDVEAEVVEDLEDEDNGNT